MRTPWRAFFDWVLWLIMPSHSYCSIDTDSMGCPARWRPGHITRLWTAEYDSKCDQKGYTYADIRYDDGADDRHPYMQAGGLRQRCMFFNEENQRFEYTI